MPTIKLIGDCRLGAIPSGFRAFEDAIEQQERVPIISEGLHLEVESKWFDLTVLSYLTLLIRRASSAFESLKIVFMWPDEATCRGKTIFLWRVGFWQWINANVEGGNVNCHPDPWKHKPNDTARTNTSQILLHQIPRDNANTAPNVTAQIAEEWESQIKSTTVAPLLQPSEVLESKEYLYLLIWELLENARFHSRGKSIALSGQIICSSSSITTDAKANDAYRNLLSNLSQQHTIEIHNTELQHKKAWLERNKHNSFLLISCGDDGIGIQRSLANNRAQSNQHQKMPNSWHTLPLTLENAFDPVLSTRMQDPSIIDVHGLSQVARLVQELSGYLFVQSGNETLEYSQISNFKFNKSPAPLLSGTMFQIALPIYPPSDSRWFSTAPAHHPDNTRKRRVMKVLIIRDELQALGHTGIPPSNEWPDFYSEIVERHNIDSDSRLYLDFVCLPPHRQFTSYLLKSLRRRIIFGNLVVLNASSQLMAITKSLEKLDAETHASDDDVTAILGLESLNRRSRSF